MVSALHRFLSSATSATAVGYTLSQGVFTVANLPEKYPVYTMAWQFKSVNNINKISTSVYAKLNLSYFWYSEYNKSWKTYKYIWKTNRINIRK